MKMSSFELVLFSTHVFSVKFDVSIIEKIAQQASYVFSLLQTFLYETCSFSKNSAKVLFYLLFQVQGRDMNLYYLGMIWVEGSLL